MNLFSAAEKIAALDRSSIRIAGETCLHSLDRSATCQACLQVCPAGAIRIDHLPHLDTDRCITCLACMPACPAGAFTADDGVPDLLNCAARVEGETVELVCEAHSSGENSLTGADVVIRVKSCLVGLGAGTYLALAALGLQKVTARLDDCAECALVSLRSQIESQVGAARRLLEPYGLASIPDCASQGLDGTTQLRPVWDASNPPLSRRDLFRLASRQGQAAAARMMAKESPSGLHRPGRDRQRMLGAMSHLPSPAAGRQVSLESLGFALVQVNEDCTACGACARACPTGALSIVREEESLHFELAFHPKLCIGCETCVRVCSANAVTLGHEPTFGQVFVAETLPPLISGELARCDRCNSLFAARPGVKLCSICEFRRKNPFGSVVTPGLTEQQKAPSE